MATRRKTKSAGPPRWLAWALGLAALGIGLWALVGRPPRVEGPPLDDIDPESREQLERVLRDAGRETGAR